MSQSLIERIANGAFADPDSGEPLAVGTRAVVNTETGELEPAALYERSALAAGDTLSGPAVIVETDTATVVSGSFDASIHPHGHIILTRKGQSS